MEKHTELYPFGGCGGNAKTLLKEYINSKEKDISEYNKKHNIQDTMYNGRYYLLFNHIYGIIWNVLGGHCGRNRKKDS